MSRYSAYKLNLVMGVLKLSVLDEQSKKNNAKMKIAAKDGRMQDVSNCSCPCWAFIKKGEVRMDEIQSTASWNID